MAGRRRLMFAKDFTVDYLRFTALDSGTITLSIAYNVNTTKLSYIEYSIDDGETWVKTDNVTNQSVTITTPTLASGDVVLWRGLGKGMAAQNTTISSSNYYSYFSSTCHCNVGGKLNSLLLLNHPDDCGIGFSDTYTYKGLFYGMGDKLIDASELIINGMSTYYCYYMFNGCSALIYPPQLLPTNVYNYGYGYMFNNCTSLRTAPQLPATTLSTSCYANMFYGCTSLTTAPELLAIFTSSNSYYQMFYNCSSLNYIKSLMINNSNSSNWVYGVASSGTFYKNPLATLPVGTSGIPEGWTVQDDISTVTEFNPQHTFTPAGYLTFAHSETIYLGLANKNSNHTIYVSKNGTNWHSLQMTDCLAFTANENCYVCGSLTYNQSTSSFAQFAVGGSFSVSGNCNALWDYTNLGTALKNYCGYKLFAYCKGLVNAQGLTLPSLTLSDGCYSYMFQECSNLVTAPSLPATTLTTNCYSYMFQNCTSLITSPSLPAETLGTYCYQYMFDGCVNLTAAPSELPAMNLTSYCYYYMFRGCTNLTTAPVLPATFIPDGYCYTYMFDGCSKLNYIKALFVTAPSYYTTQCFLRYVASTGTFIKHPLASWNETGSNGVPTGWTVQYDTTLISEFNPQNTFTPSGYLTIVHSDTIYLGLLRISTYQTVYVSKNGTSWHDLKTTDCLTFTASENCYMCGSLTNNQSTSDYTQFAANGNITISGNCNSLWDYTNLNAALKNYCGYSLFRGCYSLLNASNLTLPAMTLSSYCYSYMFYGCTSLTTAPSLPATTLENYCYEYMFYGCSLLTSPPPILPATQAKLYCYRDMFANCGALTNPPAINFEVLYSSCMSAMFEYCYGLVEAPTLKAEILVSGCYNHLFYSNSNLNYIKALFTTTPSSSYTNYWSISVASTGIFVKNINATWTTTGSHGVPTNWTIIYFDPDTEKYYLDDKTTECDDHGNPL